jgi:hypothetical protein
MQRNIYWHTLSNDAADAAFVTGAMRQFLGVLDESIPGLRLSGSQLPPQLAALILPHLESGHLEGAVEAMLDIWNASAASHLTIYCPDPSHPAVLSARRRLPHAEWGISISGLLSITYASANRHVLWHETLHLLGAQDHYDPITFRTTCELSSCLMQYAPDEQTVGLRSFLCPATAAIVRRACS